MPSNLKLEGFLRERLLESEISIGSGFPQTSKGAVYGHETTRSEIVLSGPSSGCDVCFTTLFPEKHRHSADVLGCVLSVTDGHPVLSCFGCAATRALVRPSNLQMEILNARSQHVPDFVIQLARHFAEGFQLPRHQICE